MSKPKNKPATKDAPLHPPKDALLSPDEIRELSLIGDEYAGLCKAQKTQRLALLEKAAKLIGYEHPDLCAENFLEEPCLDDPDTANETLILLAAQQRFTWNQEDVQEACDALKAQAESLQAKLLSQAEATGKLANGLSVEEVQAGALEWNPGPGKREE